MNQTKAPELVKVSKSPKYLEINRRFHWEQRSHSFQEFQKSLHRLNLDITNVLQAETINNLETLSSNLELCLEHSRSAINGAKRGYFLAYREDPKLGIMEEEHLLVNILEEVLQSAKFLKSRIDTEHQMLEYRKSIQKHKSTELASDYKGFLFDLMNSLDELSSTAKPEILQIFSIIIDRSRIAEFLFQQLNQQTNK